MLTNKVKDVIALQAEVDREDESDAERTANERLAELLWSLDDSDVLAVIDHYLEEIHEDITLVGYQGGWDRRVHDTLHEHLDEILIHFGLRQARRFFAKKVKRRERELELLDQGDYLQLHSEGFISNESWKKWFRGRFCETCGLPVGECDHGEPDAAECPRADNE